LLWLALAHPLAAALVIACLIVFAIWLVPRLWRTGRRVTGRLAGVLTSSPAKSGAIRR
jgi:hypothetical protein